MALIEDRDTCLSGHSFTCMVADFEEVHPKLLITVCVRTAVPNPATAGANWLPCTPMLPLQAPPASDAVKLMAVSEIHSTDGILPIVKDGVGLTVSVTLFEFNVLQLPVTTHRYLFAFCVNKIFDKASDAVVAPLILLKVIPPSILCCH